MLMLLIVCLSQPALFRATNKQTGEYDGVKYPFNIELFSCRSIIVKLPP